ncbi:hypothetical protein CRC_00173 [Cylindrospermopsis raciborskii CS-505]|nr:hypothetical protein CRC_00173 [Cylindrospermopsis raciborskii CS-505]
MGGSVTRGVGLKYETQPTFILYLIPIPPTHLSRILRLRRWDKQK